MPWYLELDHDSYEVARDAFDWDVPDGYNAAHDFLRKHDDPDQPALYQAYPDGRRETYSFADLDRLSDRLAHGFADLGVERGDRVGVVVPQKPENLLAHFAAWKLGAVSMPLSVLFGPQALGYRLENSGARVVVADASVADTVADVRDDCPDLEHVVLVDSDVTDDGPADRSAADELAFEDVVDGQPSTFDIADTAGDAPCVLIYTSGSTGPPKGTLHTHDVWLGHLPAFYAYFERDVADAVTWTPADWAWIGALGDLVFPALHYGRPVVGYPMGSFDAATAFDLLEEFGVTDAFLPPTAIRMLMAVDDPADRYDLVLEAVCSGGEPLTPEIRAWADDAFDGVVVNEIYGQTEANLLVCECHDWFDPKTGTMGKPVVGHDVGIVDTETGEELPAGEVGEIAVRADGDPVVFAEYWREPEKTAATRVDGWHLTGDLGAMDDDGYVRFKSRADDVIITAGYRVGPGEVERAVLEHPDVEQVGVVGLPDAERGERIAAFVQPVDDVFGDCATAADALREEIRELVREQLAKYEYPRQIEFVDELPQTTTGKIQRSVLRDRATDGGSDSQ